MSRQQAPAVHLPRSLDAQREEFSRRRGLAMPLAGTLAWAGIGLVGWLGTPYQAVMALYAGTGSIFYLGAFLSRWTGEDFFARNKAKNEFDRLFLSAVAMCLLIFTIALPWATQDYQSLPLSFGVLAGLMWLPYSWIIQHWVGVFHALMRSVLVLGAWYAFPAQRFVLIPALVVAVYLITIWVMERRWRQAQAAAQAHAPTQAEAQGLLSA